MPHHMVEIADILLSPLKGRMCLEKKELHDPRLFILSVCLVKISFVNLFLLLFMGFTTLFGIIHEFRWTISTNFFFYLQ